MFAVPGWAVSADSLKTEALVTVGNAAPSLKGSDQSNKRKRQPGVNNVTPSNVAQLWEQVIEGREGGDKTKPKKAEKGDKHNRKGLTLKEKKRLKKQKMLGNDQGADGNAGIEKSTSASHNDAEESGPRKKRKKDKQEAGHEAHETQSLEVQTKQHAAPPAPKLTPMQTAMREKLVSARFRHLNETLYTKPSAEAFQLFQDSPEMFQEYHEGFRRQVNVWPENPVDGYIEDIKIRGRHRPTHRSRSAHAPSSTSDVAPLLRTNGVCTIADLGCGDAKLATSLQADKKRMNINILSYDLQNPSPLVTKADIANLPLEDGSVNVVIFCLALMGTNWLDFIEEAYRILHWKGELWVAEIKSRLGHVSNKNKKLPVNHSVGNRKKTQGKKANGKDAEAEADHTAELAIEVDGQEDRHQETDVTAFVEALRRRGFMLQGSGNDAVDLRNKMFVKMHFVKAGQPVVGKGAVEAHGRTGGSKKKAAAKFIDAEEQGAVDESKILKPSVYKLR
ncbi:methyltransferase-domain-containing protein [Xylariaceae sp. FL0255]|nr:methyltransferase-domain-containing protein [Xylariaceae sp. FL0255]